MSPMVFSHTHVYRSCCYVIVSHGCVWHGSLLLHPCVRIPRPCIVVHGLSARACLMPVSKKQNQALPLARPCFSIPMPVFSYQVHPRPCRTAVGIYRIPCFGEIMSCFHTAILHGRVSSPAWPRDLRHLTTLYLQFEVDLERYQARFGVISVYRVFSIYEFAIHLAPLFAAFIPHGCLCSLHDSSALSLLSWFEEVPARTIGY
ncbi:hypothetical protein GOBAR_AA33277 [Gossypium barbadense]|uniref:Uncharacterized protein n=1 Tax=Gossypium barbadense TaxID=3634 RepID=A0A2P5W8J4_GOSBA|nr:hypothetical protein GOBAR_AA33277 [Gossypium barbadense]